MNDSSPTSHIPWKKNLTVLIIAEFFVLAAFNATNPIMPLFIRNLGGYSVDDAAFWSGISAGVCGIAMFISAPIWGLVADRFGRKQMVLRSMLGTAVVMGLMGLSPNMGVLIFLRVLQGILAGTVAAASSMVASTTPRDILPKAMGMLMVSVFLGNSLGPLAGGFLGEALGYEITFYFVGGTLLLSGLAVLFFVEEKFQRPASGHGSSLDNIKSLIMSKDVVPLLIATFALSAAANLIFPIVTLMFTAVGPESEAVQSAGITFFLLGICSGIASLFIGKLNARFSLRTLIISSSFSMALLFLPPLFATNATQMIVFLGISGFLQGINITASSSMLGLTVPMERQGLAYGISQSANALGMGIGPLIGGPMAAAIGLRSPLLLSCALTAAIGFLFIAMVKPARPELAIRQK